MLRAFWSMISKNPRFRPNSVIIFRVPPLSIFYPWAGGRYLKGGGRGGKGWEAQYLKGGEGRRKEERQCSCLELGKKAQSTTLCDIGHCAMCLVWIKIEWAGINSAVTLSLGGLHRQSTNAHYITFCDNTDGL